MGGRGEFPCLRSVTGYTVTNIIDKRGCIGNVNYGNIYRFTGPMSSSLPRAHLHVSSWLKGLWPRACLVAVVITLTCLHFEADRLLARS